MPQQDHGLQAHPGPPLLNGVHKASLCLLCVQREVGPAALAKAQQVQSVDGPLLGQGLQVKGPQAQTAPEAMEENHGGLVFDAVVEDYCPEHVAVQDGHILPVELSGDAWRWGWWGQD